MCGIAGWFGGDVARDEASLRDLGRDMSDAIHHRGPDAGGVWVDDALPLVLAHRRLSIIDLSPAGAQPMLSHGGRYVVSFNGEIYNFRALRSRLEAGGATFRGHSDTEVLLAAVEAWGVRETLALLEGMFAFALWDRQARELTLARDRIGEKPLYWGRVGGGLAFASELSSLRRVPGFDAGIDRDVVAQYLQLGYVPEPWSIQRGVYKLPPGCFVVLDEAAARGRRRVDAAEISRDGRDAPARYWSAAEVVREGVASRHADTRSDDEVLADVETTIGAVVDEQMVADVPLGAFLSGGIDSSTVVALMAARSERPVRTFTIGFEEAAWSEAEAAAAIAHHLGTDHTERTLSAADALAVIDEMPTVYSEPFADSSQLPTLLVARVAREHVTVVLSGDGGDELFCGYNRYRFAEKAWRTSRRLPAPVRRLGARGLRAVPPPAWDAAAGGLRDALGRIGRTPGVLRQPNIGGKAHKMGMCLASESVGEMYRGLVSTWDGAADIVPGAHALPSPLDVANAPGGLIDQFMAWDLVTYLPGDILDKVDRAAMAVSLETRLPLLDRRVAEMAWRLPERARVRDGQAKWALRQVLYRHVPRALIDRPKMGFSVPVAAWLRGPLRSWADGLLDEARLRDQGLLDAGAVQTRWREHRDGRRDHAAGLWAVLMLQSWLEATAG